MKSIKLKNLKFSNAENIVQRDALIFTNDFKKEFYWLQYNIINNIELVCNFITLKAKFENSFLRADYNLASNILNNIREVCGENLWTIEMSLLIKEYSKDTTENWAELSKYLMKIRSPFYQFVISFYSKRIEEKMSFDNCFTQFQNDFDSIDIVPEVQDFLVFKCLFVADFEYQNNDVASVIYSSNIYGVIDQYLILIEVLQKKVVFDSTFDSIIISFLKKIQLKIPNDTKVIQLLNLLDVSADLVELSYTREMFEVNNAYLLGEYEFCKKLCLDIIDRNPGCFEAYELYVKSLICNKESISFTHKSSIINSIIGGLYSSMQCDKNSANGLQILLKHSLTLLSFDLGKQLYAYAADLQGLQFSNNFRLISYLSSSYNDPSIINTEIKERISTIHKKYLNYSNNLYYNANSYISGDVNIRDKLISIDSLQYDILSAQHHFNIKSHDRSIMFVEKYIQQNIPAFQLNVIYHLLFDSYILQEYYEKAIILIGTILSDDTFFATKINITNLTRKIDEIGVEHYSHLIDTPILFNAITKNYALYAVYDEFMTLLDESYPSKLDIQYLISSFSLQKVVYFLKNVCISSTIQYSQVFSSINEAEQERLEICNILRKIDKANISLYDKEISEILRMGAVRKAIKEVDEGRLFVNVESLKNLQLNSLKESFIRYKEIENASKEKNLIAFNASKERNWINNESPKSDGNDSTINPTFLAFKSIYLETRDKFLFSKEFGLDSCLSTRIRHGALKNHIRSVFEKLSLITSKSENGYIENTKWAEQFSHNYDLNITIQNRLKIFSKQIDDYTNYIVEHLIQIQTEKKSEKKEGLFNYNTNDKILWSFMMEFKDSILSLTDIIDLFYTDLANYTAFLFRTVHQKITTDINNKFQEFIDSLQSDIRNITPNQTDLLQNILKSSTAIQKELAAISEWFIFSTTAPSSLLNIETVINASKEYINKINPNNLIEPIIKLNYPDDLVIISNSHMIFVFNILLDNIITHSGLSPSEIRSEISVCQIGNYVEVLFTNNLSSSVDLNKIKLNLQNVKDNWNNHTSIERANIEGNSGFDKIKRILLYEALSKTDRFEYLVDKNHVAITIFLPFKQYTDEQIPDNRR